VRSLRRMRPARNALERRSDGGRGRVKNSPDAKVGVKRD